jgi:hypothetical protein
MQSADADGAADRLGHRDVEPADQPAHGLADDQAKRIGAEHGDDGRGVEPPHHATLDHEPKRADRKRRRHHADGDRQARAVDEIGDVGAEQDEFTLREIEDAHHAGDDAKSQHDEDDDRAEAQNLEQCNEQRIHFRRHTTS